MPTTVAEVSIPEDEIRRARRIEVYVYLFTAVALIVLGVFLTSKILNWIVGPAFVVVMVTVITPQVLKIAGVRDPDAGTADRPAAVPEPPG
jgi:FtsH-binding integral membrane protein